MATDLKERNRNLPGQEPDKRMPFTNAPKDGEPLSPEELAKFQEIEKNFGDPSPSQTLQRLAEDESILENPVNPFVNDLLGTSKPSSGSSSAPSTSFRPTLGKPSDSGRETGSKLKSGPKSSQDSEVKGLSNILNQENQNILDSIQNRQNELKKQKVNRFNIRGRARKRIRLLALGAVFSIAAAVPIGILGVIPHAMQGWVQNKVSAYTERAVDKMGQRVLYSFIQNRVAIDKCKNAYNAAGNVAGVGACRPRLNERDTRLSQLFNDWHSAKMEDKLLNNGINVEYDYAQRSAGGKPYKITINRPESEGGNFQVSGEFGVPDLDSAEFTGRRETSLILRKEMKTILKEDTRWFQYLKRRNLKAGYLRDLGLPSRVFPSKRVAQALDNVDEVKIRGVSKFRQHLTKWVVSKGDGRVGALLEILLSGNSSKGKPSEIIKTNKALAAAAEKLGAEKIEKYLADFGGKNLTEIQIQIVKNLVTKFSEELAEKFGDTALKAVPIIGWVLLSLTILDALDLATDGTLQHWISSQNAQAMLDVANLMDTTVSEEKRGYVDAASAGDIRLSLINGLGSSRVFANMVGYSSPSGKQPAGYNCKPDVSITDVASLSGAIEEVVGKGDPSSLPQVGMAPDQLTCENHRVDYDPLSSISSSFGLVQTGLGVYTSNCIAILPNVPGCPSLQGVYHGAQGGFSWVLDFIGVSKLFEIVADLPPIKAMMSSVTGWMSNGISVLVTGQSLVGPEVLQGGLKTDSKSGARIVDGWVGGGEVTQFAFAKGVGEGGGLGGVPLTTDQTSALNDSIAAERKEELASSSFFDRMFDISHTDTLASGAMAMAVTEGGFGNFINPLNNIALAFGSASSDTYADSSKDTCGYTNKKGQAVTEFGVVCYGIPDSYIDSLTDEQIQDLADPDRCEAQTSALDAKRKEAEDGTDESQKDPDGTGTSTQIDGCRLLCTVTDVMGTNFRTDDKICGFESSSSAGSSAGSDASNPQIEGALGKCENTAATRPNEGEPKNDIEIQVVPGTSIDISANLCKNVLQMVEAAKVDGVVLDGGGFRTYKEQVALRRSNCGTSNYAIYQVSPSACNPPTAIPGTSNHEDGTAIDFSNCSSRGSSCYIWLNTNASKYGFKNFPPEPWHWSTSGS